MTQRVRAVDENGLYWLHGECGEVGSTIGARSPNTKITLVRPAELIVASLQKGSTRRKLVRRYAPHIHHRTPG